MGAPGVTHNPLLVKDSVGKTRPTVYDLPGVHHVYGKKIERDPQECAAQGNLANPNIQTTDSVTTNFKIESARDC
jgi:hypothetical protein